MAEQEHGELEEEEASKAGHNGYEYSLWGSFGSELHVSAQLAVLQVDFPLWESQQIPRAGEWLVHYSVVRICLAVRRISLQLLPWRDSWETYLGSYLTTVLQKFLISEFED